MPCRHGMNEGLLCMQAARQDLKDAKDGADSREYNFQKELAMAQKLATLYKEANEERNKKVAELEGIMRELQQHLEVWQNGWMSYPCACHARCQSHLGRKEAEGDTVGCTGAGDGAQGSARAHRGSRSRC